MSELLAGMLMGNATCDGSRTLKGWDDGLGIGGVGVDVSVSELSLQADPAGSRNASARLLSSFFTIECYDSMKQRNQIYQYIWNGRPLAGSAAKPQALCSIATMLDCQNTPLVTVTAIELRLILL